MSQPINAIAPVGPDRLPSAVESALRLREAQPQADEATGANGEARPAKTAPVRAESRFPAYRVTLDPKTSLMTTEIFDTWTGDVVMRIPVTYVDPEELVHGGGRPAGARREVEA
jgi:hypothetical protein